MASPITVAPFGGYTDLTTGSVVNATAAAFIAGMFVDLLALLPDSANQAVATTYCPEFDKMPPAMEQLLRAEITALAAAIAASPTS